jgi:hypothetical protein
MKTREHELTLNLLMSYICMELLVKPEILTSYMYGPTFGNAESRLFLFAAQCFKTESMQKVKEQMQLFGDLSE